MISKVEHNRPDVTIANRIRAIFEDDPDIKMEYTDATHETHGKVTIHVYNNSKKAAAIRKMIKPCFDDPEKTSVPLDVDVIDETGVTKETILDAFTGNPHFSDYMDIPSALDPSVQFHVCIFNKEVIQFKNDNGGSLHGYEFRLMEDLARECLDVPMLLYTTEDGIPRDKK